ncbi:MAG TPA: universal stress protein [Dehalococcoidia bacterium]|nr:universal stress protein [Dehalococcoidia bacterium]
MVTAGDRIGRRVIVAWDGSPAASTAVPVARRIAGQLGAEVEALYVAHDAAEKEGWQAKLGAEAERLGVSVRLVTGEPSAEIVRATEREGVCLVALTMHGRDVGEKGHRLGRIAKKVIASTVRPVLLVKPEAAEGKEAGPVRRLLVPIDGTPKTAAALQPVTQLAHDLKASIDFLYVADPRQKPPLERGSITAPRYVDQPQHEWPEWANEVMRRLSEGCAGCPEDVEVRIYLGRGDAGEEITHFAREKGSDAIVLVRRSRFQPGRAKVIRAVLERTTSHVIIVGCGEEA